MWVSFDDGAEFAAAQPSPHLDAGSVDLRGRPDPRHARSLVLDSRRHFAPRQIKADSADTSNLLFKPAPAYRVRCSTYTDTPMPPDEPAGENPPNGAIVDYYLSHLSSGAVTLEIFDAQGSQIFEHGQTRPNPRRNREATDSSLLDSAAEDSPPMRNAPLGLGFALSRSARVAPRIPDIRCSPTRYPASSTAAVDFPASDRRFHGRRRVELFCTTQRANGILRARERLRALFAMQTNLADRMTRSSEAVTQTRSIHEQLEKLAARANESTKEAIEALDKK